MPRRVDYRKRRTQLKKKQRDERNDRYQVYGSGRFFDHYGNFTGTLPEKMVLAELIERGIDFEYQAFRSFNIKEISFKKDYRPDFLIPSRKIIIEVQGAYWHSKPETQKSDATKFTVFEMLGYKVLVWWDYDIMYKLDDLFAQAGLKHLGGRGERIITGKEAKYEDNKGIITLNKKRALRNLYKKPVKYKKQNNKAKKSFQILS